LLLIYMVANWCTQIVPINTSTQIIHGTAEKVAENRLVTVF